MLLNGQRPIRCGVTWTMVEHRDHQRPDAQRRHLNVTAAAGVVATRFYSWMTWIAVSAFSGPLHPACTDLPADPVTSTSQMSVRFGAHPVISSEGPQSRHVVLWGGPYPGHFACLEVSGSGRSMRSAPERLELVDGGRACLRLDHSQTCR